jgi:peptidoglycan/LPS O-acetylase OafA/YrhL
MLLMLELEIVLHFFWGQEHTMDWNAPLYTFLLNLVFLQHIGLYNTPTWDGNAWSLTPEIVANLIWFYLVTTRKLSSKLLVVTIIGLAILQYNKVGTLNGLILNSFLVRCGISYAMGCLLYRHFIANPAITPPSPFWSNVMGLSLLGLIFAIIVDVGLVHLHFFHDWDWILVLFVFPAITYLALQPKTVLNAILSSRLFVFFGTISYSVYLLHVQVALSIRGACKYYGIIIYPPYKGFLYLLLTVGLATLTYRLVEVPARRALRERLEPFLRKIFFDPH